MLLPLDALKIKMQVGNDGKTALQIVKEEGLGLYRGAAGYLYRGWMDGC